MEGVMGVPLIWERSTRAGKREQPGGWLQGKPIGRRSTSWRRLFAPPLGRLAWVAWIGWGSEKTSRQGAVRACHWLRATASEMCALPRALSHPRNMPEANKWLAVLPVLGSN